MVETKSARLATGGRKPASWFLALLALELICFGPRLFKTGFYYDDWALLNWVMPERRPDIGAGMARFVAARYWDRPAEIVLYPLLIGVGGGQPWRYRLIGLCVESLTGLFLVLLLRRLTGNESLALLAAALALVFPNHTATHFWMTASPSRLSMLFLAAGLHVHTGWLRSRGPRFLWAGQILFALALLEYESIAFLPAALAAALMVRHRGKGGTFGSAAKAAGRDTWPFAVTLGLVFVYRQGLLPALAQGSQKQVQASLGHFLRVYWEGLRCVSTEVLGFWWYSMRGVWGAANAAAWVAWLPVSIGLAVWLDPARSSARKKGGGTLLAFSAAFFLFSLVPFALSGEYTPRIWGVVNRVNLGAGMAAGMALAVFLARLPAMKRGLPCRRGAVTAVLAFCVVCQWDAGDRWTRAWEIQKTILEDIESRLPPEGSTILLYGSPANVGGAPVFKTHYDLAQALRLRTGLKNLQANWIYSAFLREDGLSIVNGDDNKFEYGYDGLYLYNWQDRRFGRLEGEESLKAFGLSGAARRAIPLEQ